MSSPDKIHIIGIGSDGPAGLTRQARDTLNAASLIFGSVRTLQLVEAVGAEKIPIASDLQQAVLEIERNLGNKRMVVVAGGDPLFYGVARFLCDRIGKDRFEVLPHVSSMQLAFARVKESWEEAYLTNLATHSLGTVLDNIRIAEKVGLFTSEKESPAAVAQQLLARGLDYFRAYVCENLGGPDERVTQGELDEIKDMEFAPLNVMILVRKPGRPDRQRQAVRFRRFGNPDEVFAQSQPKRGLITQAEVRAIALAQMDVQPGSVVWDIGAGSGSLAIEAARLADPGTVYAVEQDAADYHLILANAETFGVTNLKAIHGAAPEVFAELPQPDAVFVGGTGQEIASVIEAAWTALAGGGTLVANVATLEMLFSVYVTLKAIAPRVQVMTINIARATEQLETIRFEALNPTFLLWAEKTASP